MNVFRLLDCNAHLSYLKFNISIIRGGANLPPKAVTWVGWTENRSFHRGVQNERYGSFWISAPFKCHFQRKVSSAPFYYLHFCVAHRPNMQKWSTQILYQYLGTKVCLHSYNDTASANTGVIIERCFRGFPPLEGVQILSSVPSLLCDALRCHPAYPL